MLLLIKQSAVLAARVSRLRQVVVCVCIALFLFQLVVTAGHRHEAADTKAHCVVCHAAAPALGDLPAAGAVLLALWLAVAYLLARRPEGEHLVVPAFLRPASQAPPARSVLPH